MNKLLLICAVSTVILSIINIILNWNNNPAVYGWFVAAIGWVQLIIPQKK
jgi:hypothetical protein